MGSLSLQNIPVEMDFKWYKSHQLLCFGSADADIV